MVTPIDFFTPVEFSGERVSCSQKALEYVDHYFYLGGNIAKAQSDSSYHCHCNSQYVEITRGKTEWWMTALKVISYATIVLPGLLLILKAVLRSQYHFHKVDESRVFAPLTLVRTAGVSDLKISLLFNQQMKPCQPTFPNPSEILGMKHSWNVRTAGDGTMTHADQRIHMIWWESLRSYPKPLDPNKAVCVPKGRITQFLDDVLTRKGLRDSEKRAFIEYWTCLMEQSEEPFLLIELVGSQDLFSHIPNMEIEGANGSDFALERIYFKFHPVSDQSLGISEENYLRGMEQTVLGSNVVLDLGGEITNPAFKVDPNWESTFNPSFIDRFICPRAQTGALGLAGTLSM